MATLFTESTILRITDFSHADMYAHFIDIQQTNPMNLKTHHDLHLKHIMIIILLLNIKSS